jgi:hypothetical protein
MFKRALIHALMVFALLLAQHGALAHAISHVFQDNAGTPASDPGGKSKLPHSVFCAHWLGYAGAHGASGAHGFWMAAAASCFELAADTAAALSLQRLRAFESRAPPFAS